MYQLSQPAAALAAYIERYWFVAARPGEPFQLTVDVYVDARADLIFNFGAPYERAVIGGPALAQQDSNLDAQRTYPIKISQRGAVSVAGVRFHSAGLSPFVSTSVSAWSERVVPIAEAFGAEALVLERALRAQAGDVRAMSQTLDAWFTSRLQLTPAKRALQALKSRIEAEGGLTRIQDLCAHGAISIRQLDRLFRNHLGFSPKTFSRIVRFQRALTMLKGAPPGNLAEVAALCGYYDQPHFVREFRGYAGTNPRAQSGYFPSGAPADFSPNLVQFVQDRSAEVGHLSLPSVEE